MHGMNIVTFCTKHAGKLILFLVSGFCLFYALAFVRLYFMEHPYRVASRWIYENVPAGSTIIGPHWDDRVPVGIGAFNGSRYKMEGRDYEFPLYERDTPRIASLLTSRLSATDYIAFATPRAIDSVPRIPDEYPNTTALLRLLWAEKLGFKLVYSTKNRPALFGFSFNDDLADESFSVYDHPKVVVFQNVERLSQEEITLRIQSAKEFGPLPTMDEMLLMDEGGWEPAQPIWPAEWTIYLQGVALIQVMATCFVFLFGGVLKRFPASVSVGLAPLGGVLLTVGVFLVGAKIRLLTFTKEGMLAVVVLLSTLALLRAIFSDSSRSHGYLYCRRGLPLSLVILLLGSGLSLVMLSLRADAMDISDYVEQAYLWYVAGASTLPSWELFDGSKAFSLWHFDRLLFGSLMKVFSGMEQHMFSLMFLLSGALVCGLTFSLVSAVVRSTRSGIVATVLLVIPLFYVGFAQRLKVNTAIGAGYSLEDARVFSKLGRWISEEVKGGAVVGETCISSSVVGLSGAPSVPIAHGLERGECPNVDAVVLYNQLMKQGVELFLVDMRAKSAHGVSDATLLEARPDLFSRAYDSDSIAVYVPAFSKHYALLPRDS